MVIILDVVVWRGCRRVTGNKELTKHGLIDDQLWNFNYIHNDMTYRILSRICEIHSILVAWLKEGTGYQVQGRYGGPWVTYLAKGIWVIPIRNGIHVLFTNILIECQQVSKAYTH